MYKAIPAFGRNCESFTVIDLNNIVVYHVSVVNGKIKDILIWDNLASLWYHPPWDDRDPTFAMRHGIAMAVYKMLELA